MIILLKKFLLQTHTSTHHTQAYRQSSERGETLPPFILSMNSKWHQFQERTRSTSEKKSRLLTSFHFHEFQREFKQLENEIGFYFKQINDFLRALLSAIVG